MSCKTPKGSCGLDVCRVVWLCIQYFGVIMWASILEPIYNGMHNSMRDSLKSKILEVCNKKIDTKGANVGLSFYAFFANKNDDPECLMEVATWWIMTHKLDHFEKATKIKRMVQAME